MIEPSLEYSKLGFFIIITSNTSTFGVSLSTFHIILLLSQNDLRKGQNEH